MKIIAHIGAHRTSSTTFQAYLTQNADLLARAGLTSWTPEHTRGGMFAGLTPGPRPATRREPAVRARGRIRLQLEGAQARGTKTLLVSEENMIGSTRGNLRAKRLYPAIGEQMARYDWVFDGRIDRVILSVRSHEHWWASAIAYAVRRGASVPSAQDLSQIAQTQRGWRDVVADLACAMPHTEILVLPFETFAGRPDLMLGAGADMVAPVPGKTDWLNKAPDLAELQRVLRARDEDVGQLPEGTGRWSPFDFEQQAQLRELYADDLFWLTAGADGLATLTEDPLRETWQDSWAGKATEMDGGHIYDRKDRALAQPG